MHASPRHRYAAALATAAVLFVQCPDPASASGPLTRFAGRWRGAGMITMSDGSREAVRCKAAYAVDDTGAAMDVTVDCASDSYRVDLVGSVTAHGTELSGRWQETSRQVQGEVTGQVAGPGDFRATLQGIGFDIALSAKSDGRRQAVVVQSSAGDVQSVAVSLRR